MKKLLKRTLLGIPLGVILLVLLSTAVVAAGFLVWQYTFQTEVVEPITVEVTEELTNPMYPGLGTNAEYIITNSGSAPLSINAAWPGQETGSVKCYATIRYIDSEGASLDDIVRVDYDGAETFTLYTADYAPAGKSNIAKVQLGVLVGADAPPGLYNFPVSISRG